MDLGFWWAGLGFWVGVLGFPMFAGPEEEGVGAPKDLRW
jgi:hypothetical protein